MENNMAKEKKQRVYVGIVIDADLKADLSEEACLTSRSLAGQVKFILREWQKTAAKKQAGG